jgi:hypothetical protein
MAQSVAREVSVAAAAGLIGCSSKTVIRLLEASKLDGWRVSDRGWWRVDMTSVLRFRDRRHAPRVKQQDINRTVRGSRWRPSAPVGGMKRGR